MATYSSYYEAPVLDYQLGIKSARFPQEILDIINQYIVGGNPRASDFMGEVPAHLCRVNSRWHSTFTPMLYASYRYEGDVNQIGSLWCFVRTIVQRKDHASLVRELTFTTKSTHRDLGVKEKARAFELLIQHKCTFQRYCQEYPIGDDCSIPDDTTLAWFCQARPPSPEIINWVDVDYGNQDEEDQCLYRLIESIFHEWYIFSLYEHNRGWFDPVLKLFTEENAERASMMLRQSSAFFTCNRNGDGYGNFQMPLMAIIIALCPQIVRLNMDTWAQDPFLEEVMAMGTGKRPLLQISRPLANVERVRVGGPAESFQSNRTSISHYKSYWSLPKLKELVMLNAEISADLESQTPSDIEHLTVQTEEFLQGSISTLFTVTCNLRCLTLGLQVDHTVRGWYHGAKTGEILPDGPHQYLRVWQMIHHLKDTLCFLELYQDRRDIGLPPRESLPVFATDRGWNNGELPHFCPPLGEFTKLRQLNIPVLGLYGHNCKHEEGTKFGNHLPPKLESLGLYANGGNWMDRHFCALDHELESISVAGSVAQGGSLRAITCHAPTGTESDITKRMKDAALANGIMYIPDAKNYLFYGGLNTFWACYNNNAWFSTDGEAPGSFIERCDPGRVIPRGMTVHGYKGRL
ncbi:hypothetical protein ASPVEDRAFT_86188 [Aspergillus versicolor CBS 583.65]|uniref:Uncharacterized protein n=1 Tax=Aspergillus versicolor CBS 583.65 TaxID=1036611 RepID=A0A1L9PTE7_ASPVE|nr:uncharacterized protein ASPVEDRAFT_86188 [Aspergillus versicolor CBS 583.65]OJJ04808.1 hypothetical protein ASPVEDRAFT_86188 [Aspergillus versicolor CBS 583.65]